MIVALTAGVNPLDNMIIKGEVKLIVPYRFPLVMGNEFCGIIKTGVNVKGFAVGDRVYARRPLAKIGAFAEYTAIDYRAIAKVPEYLSDDWVRPDGDPGRIAKKALTNMVMKKAIDYPEPKPGFMQI